MPLGANALRLSYLEPGAELELGSALGALLVRLDVPRRPLVYLCIGTDRSTGDSLGPLVGDRLVAHGLSEAEILGTLGEPVHASNLLEVLTSLRTRLPDAVVVAVDACLGRVESVGTITVGAGALVPGAGVNKSLPEVGVAYVTGTVNVGGFMEYFVLQNTRLHLVMRMAEVMAAGLATAARWPGRAAAGAAVAAAQAAPALA